MMIILAFMYGTMAGSFFNMLVYRVKKGIHLFKPVRSFCDNCGATINPVDLIPVLGWLIRRGRSRCCGQPIKPLYPVIELTTGVFFALTMVLIKGGV